MAARVRALSAGAAAAPAPASSSSACNIACSIAWLRWLSGLACSRTCLQQRLLAAALTCSRNCLCGSTRLRYVQPREKASPTVRNSGFVRFIHTVRRTETAVAIIECPEKEPENRTKSKLSTAYIY